MYADWAEGEATVLAQAVYDRCLAQIPSIELWTAYLTFCKRLLPLEEVTKAYAKAVDLLGTDHQAGIIWTEYMTLVKHIYNTQTKKENPDADVQGKLLAEDANPIEVARKSLSETLRKRIEGKKAGDISDEEFLRVGESLNVDLEYMRRAFQRASSTAHHASEKLWVGYEQLEKSLGNPTQSQKLLAEHMPRFVKAKAAFKELQSLCAGLDYSIAAVPLTAKNSAQQHKLFDKWRSVIRFEQTNPLRLERKDLQARVTLLFQQAALSCAYHTELWHDFADWLDAGNQQAQAMMCLERALERFLPQDLTLRLLLCHRKEVVESPLSPSALQAAEAAYLKLLDESPKPTPLALINYLAFVRRQHGGGDFRAAFVEKSEASPHCTWEAYQFVAETEYHVFGNTEAACKVFRLGLERYGDREPSLLVAYINFLISINDLRSARAELSQGVMSRLQVAVRDKLSKRSDPQLEDAMAFLWQKWTRLERYFGDAASIQRCVLFRDEEFRRLQQDQGLDEDSIVETPAAFGLSMTMSEVEEGFRYQHLKPQAAYSPATPSASSSQKSAAQQPEVAAAPAPSVSPSSPNEALVDSKVQDAVESQRRLGPSVGSVGQNVHIARPDVSKMLAFRPALDVLGLKKESFTSAWPSTAAASAPPRTFPGVPFDPRRPPPPAAPVGGAGGAHTDEEKVPVPTMIPKCLQDLLAVLPTRPLKGAKPDVDYLLTVLQTVNIPAIPVKELERFRYDSLRLRKEEDNANLRKHGLVKDDLDGDGGSGGFFSNRPTIYRDRLQAKRQRLAEEMRSIKKEG